MANKKSTHVTSLKSFLTFTRYFLHYCFILRGLLGVQVAIVLLFGIAFARCEDIAIGQGVYFSLITSTTVGFGDVTPKTGVGQCISVFLAFAGTILFGLVVAVATKAFTVTIQEYSKSPKKTPPNTSK
jgi:hypothetical protein